MSDFSIKINELRVQAERLGEIAESMNAQAGNIDSLSDSLETIGLGALKINFIGLVHTLRRRAGKARELQNVLYRIIARFLMAEQEIMGMTGTLTGMLEEILDRIQEYVHELFDTDEFEMDSIVFDDQGWYGGDQGSPKNTTGKNREALYDIIRENNPDHEFTDEELEVYLERANSEGCGYIALINSIFVQFADDPEMFEKTFGYPMYTLRVGADGKLIFDFNYDMLFIDLYSSMDNINPYTGEFSIYNDFDIDEDGSIYDYNYWDDSSGKGTNSISMDYYCEHFLEEHGINAEYNNYVNVSPEKVQDIIESGETIIISFFDGNIYDTNGNPHPIHGGHGMVITGVTANGRYIVSSWGEKYYIDPNEQAGFTDDDGNVIETTMHYDTVDITL
ncbi:MAG: hypothetical protein PUA62_07370 [Lachnospiraceae bacterium]|nr:hypothetical protein [Lachnospiraceae bacterium]